MFAYYLNFNPVILEKRTQEHLNINKLPSNLHEYTANICDIGMQYFL